LYSAFASSQRLPSSAFFASPRSLAIASLPTTAGSASFFAALAFALPEPAFGVAGLSSLGSLGSGLSSLAFAFDGFCYLSRSLSLRGLTGTTSGSDDVFEHTTGTPAAMASSSGKPKPS
jgi:hypothetical protein